MLNAAVACGRVAHSRRSSSPEAPTGLPIFCSGRVLQITAILGVTGQPSMPPKPAVVHSDPEILSGTPVFVGTRVPVQSLFDYIEGGDTLDEFLRQFPSVKRDQAIAALELARDTLLASARTA